MSNTLDKFHRMCISSHWETMDIHIHPIKDLRDHNLKTRDCWCKPRVEVGEVTQVIHNSADGRELVEQHGIN